MSTDTGVARGGTGGAENTGPAPKVLALVLVTTLAVSFPKVSPTLIGFAAIALSAFLVSLPAKKGFEGFAEGSLPIRKLGFAGGAADFPP